MFAETLWDCIYGPRLYAIYSTVHKMYDCNLTEGISILMFMFINGMRHVLMPFSPFIFGYAYVNSMLNSSSAMSFLKVIGSYYVMAYGLRFIGRMSNPEYKEFSRRLNNCLKSPKPETLKFLNSYDFQVSRFLPVFKAQRTKRIYVKSEMPVVSRYLQPAYDVLAYWCVNSFGRQMTYPGATALCRTLWFNLMNVNRMKLIFEQKGQRNLIETVDGNIIDTVFIDRRGLTEYGDFLVITCEGNAGCYEFGMMGTPFVMGFSVLGWNIPGFGESTGNPYPMEILNGMDSVMQFTMDVIGFKQEKVLIYSWSIGCFPGTWAAANFPNIQGLVLDAGFDDLLPLAYARIPPLAKPIVEYAVRKYLNLPVARQLALYNGPVTLIRRLFDDIVVTIKKNSSGESLPYNRANELLKTLFYSRHKPIYNSCEPLIDEWLKSSHLPERSERLDWTMLSPESFGDLPAVEQANLISRACEQYLLDYKADHHTQLSEKFFDTHMFRTGLLESLK